MQTSLSSISIATAKGRYYFSPSDIVRLEANSNYTNIYFTDKKKILSAKLLKDFVPMLEPFGFVRTHRTHLVNRQYIMCITSGGKIIMKDASVAGVSRRMKGQLMKLLKNAA